MTGSERFLESCGTACEIEALHSSRHYSYWRALAGSACATRRAWLKTVAMDSTIILLMTIRKYVGKRATRTSKLDNQLRIVSQAKGQAIRLAINTGRMNWNSSAASRTTKLKPRALTNNYNPRL